MTYGLGLELARKFDNDLIMHTEDMHHPDFVVT